MAKKQSRLSKQWGNQAPQSPPQQSEEMKPLKPKKTDLRRGQKTQKSSFYLPYDLHDRLSAAVLELKKHARDSGTRYTPTKNDFVVIAVNLAVEAYENDPEGATVTKQLINSLTA